MKNKTNKRAAITVATISGNWSSPPGSEPDITIIIEEDNIGGMVEDWRDSRTEQVVNIKSMHGQKRKIIKETSMSLVEVEQMIVNLQKIVELKKRAINEKQN